MADIEDVVPLDEFCAETSATDRRVELLACFHFRERMAGRFHDTRQAYAARYAVTEAMPTAR